MPGLQMDIRMGIDFKHNIYIVEDEADILELLQITLRGAGYKFSTVTEEPDGSPQS